MADEGPYDGGCVWCGAPSFGVLREAFDIDPTRLPFHARLRIVGAVDLRARPGFCGADCRGAHEVEWVAAGSPHHELSDPNTRVGAWLLRAAYDVAAREGRLSSGPSVQTLTARVAP